MRFRLACLALAMSLVAGCTASPGLRGAIEGATVLVRGSRDTTPNVTAEDTAALARANAAFALDLYRVLAAGSEDNIVVGPHSISSVLAMVYEGARGDTAAEMARVLHFDELPSATGPAFNALDIALRSRSDGSTVDLRLASQAFAQPGLELLESYLETLTRDYGAPLAELDFGRGEEARQVVNRWAAERTDNRITELFPPGSLHPNTVLVLANAISMYGQWQYRFDPELTTNETFHLPDGTTATVPMMHFDYSLPLDWTDEYSAVELMYGRGDLSMVLIVASDLAAFEASLTPERLQAIFDSITDQGIHLRLPRFSFNTHFDLDDTLQALGMSSVYSAADLSGMTGSPGLYLDTVQHEAFIKVDENGTEAHAASGAGIPISHGPTISFDRPFFFVIRDRATGAILFLGRVTDPRG